jgi:hypothetical protein
MDQPRTKKPLAILFKESAEKDTLPPDIRQFAALCAVLARRLQRAEFHLAGLDKVVAEFILETRGNKTGTPAATSPQQPVAAEAPVEVDDEESATQKLIDDSARETQADLEAVAQAPVTPLRKKQKIEVENAS